MAETMFRDGMALLNVSAGGASDTLLSRNTTSGIVTELTRGSLTEDTSSILTITGGTGGVIGDITIEIAEASAAQDGYLSSADWTTFNSKLSGADVTGDITFSGNTASIAAGVIVNADIHGSAAIAWSKMATLDNNRAAVINASGWMEAHSATTDTEIGFINGLSSPVQTQLDSKLTVNISSPAQGDLMRYDGSEWVNFARGASGEVLTSTGTDIEWGTPTANGVPVAGSTAQYLRKVDATNYNTEWATLTLSVVTDISATAAEVNILAGTEATANSLNYTSDLSNYAQAQLDDKLNNNLALNAVWIGGPGNTAQQVSAGANNSIFTIVSGVPTWQAPPAAGTFTGPVSSTDNAVVRFNGAAGNSGQDSGVIISDTNDVSGVANLTIATAGAIRTATSAGNTMLLQAYDVNDTVYTTFVTLTANNTPTCDLSTSVTQGGAVIYRAGGTDVALADGGTGASLAGPGADRIMFWDDSAGAVTWLTVGSNLTITGTTLDASLGGGAFTGPGASTDNALVRFDGAGGATGQNSVAILSDTGDLSGIVTLSATNVTLATTGALRTSTSAGNTLLLQAYDVNGAAYITFGTLTANDTPTFDLSTSVTLGGAAIYRANGTDVTLADGGTGASLADPGADRILFWDDSAGAMDWLTANTSFFTITGTSIGLANNSVDDAQIRQFAGLSVLGRSANSTGDGADITAGTDGYVLRRSGTTLSFGQIGTDSISALDIDGTLGANSDTAIPSQKAVKTYTTGLQDLYIPAAAMWARSTSGCAPITRSEISTSLVNIQTLDFDQSTIEYAQFTVSLPRNWNGGTITVKFYWTAAGGSGDVVWSVSGGAYSNDDALSTALGTAQSTTDTLITTNDLHITSATSAMTFAGTPADADFLAIQISRDATNVADTLTADAKLIGVVITLTTDSAKAA